MIKNGTNNCRVYGEYLGKLFKDHKNLVWIQGGDRDPLDVIDHYREIANGIKKYIPDALQTYHASSSNSSSDVIPYFSNGWMNFVFTYTYFRGKMAWLTYLKFGEMPEVYEVNYFEYSNRPIRPYVLGESQYEGEGTAGNQIAGPEIARRQAYWSVLSGSCGSAYGSWNWKMDTARWRDVKNDRGAWDMGISRRFFESFNWYDLIPDIEGKIITEGKGVFGTNNYTVAAYTSDRSHLVIYLPPTGTDKRTIKVDLSLLNKPCRANWFNPATGEIIEDKNIYQVNTQQVFVSPGNNGEGQNDWVLWVVAEKE
ncbi:MAG: DUF4038 domain-containing protein [Bacteroidales bacterium]|nr:DUF4038 domain-containing protein [Bacteroidales bacterium]